MRQIWLASASPRRRQLLEWVGFQVQGGGVDIDESEISGELPSRYAMRLAQTKAERVHSDALVLAADTVVHHDGLIYGKPADRAHAREMLLVLSDRTHEVTTGVAIRRGDRSRVFAVTTKVRFRELAPAEVDAYVATGESDDKAGAYGIQGRAGVFVTEIHGSWTNVMGLPVAEVLEALAGM